MGLSERFFGVDNADFIRSFDIQLVFLISIISSMGSVVSPALPAMSSTLEIPEARIGLVFTAFTFPAIFALPVVGIVADLYGRKAAVVPGMLLFGGAGMAVALTKDFRLILALRGIQGVGYTAFNSLTVALLGDLLTGETENAAQGARVLLNKTTGFAGPAVAGVLAGIAWYYPFYLYGLSIPAGLLIYFRLGETTEEDPSAATDGGADESSADRGVHGYVTNVYSLLTDPFVIGILGAGFFRMFLKYALYTFLALMVVEQYSSSIGYSGLLVGLYSLIGAVTASQSARFTERFSYSYALLLGFVVASVAFIAFPLAADLVVVTTLVLLHGVGEGIINPVHKSILSQSVEYDLRAGLVTTNAIVQNTAKTVTPVILGSLLVLSGSSGYTLLFAITGAVTLMASAVATVGLVVGSRSERRLRLSP